MMKRAFLLAVCVAGAGLSGKPTTAATLPKEFTGVWIAAAETDNECKKQDWKGVAGENDCLINITAKAIEEFESGCMIKSLKTSRDSPPGARTSEVNLSCRHLHPAGPSLPRRAPADRRRVDSRDQARRVPHHGAPRRVRRPALTRNGKDWTGRFPTIVDAAAGLKARSCLIDDGEAVLPR